MDNLFDELFGGFMDKHEIDEMAELGLRSADEVYGTSPIRRRRGSRAEVEQRRQALVRIVARMRPMTVRQVFYQATSVHGLVEKTEAGYRQIQNDLVLLRRAKRLAYDSLADATRWQRKPRTYDSPQEAVAETARLYRKRLWTRASVYVEIWLEKDALAGVVWPITDKYDVPLMVSRGYASLSFLHSAAEAISKEGRPTYIYHLGDYDPSGVNAGAKIEQTLREMAPEAEIHFERLAVTEAQIALWRLPTRPTKKTDSRAKGFGEISVELDAIEPSRLRALVEGAILEHLPQRELDVLKVAEESEREVLDAWARALN